MKGVIAVIIILCSTPLWADGTPECDAFLAVTNSLFCTATTEATSYIPADWPSQVWSIVRPYVENPEIDPATGGNLPDHINGFHVDLNADGTNEFVIEVQRFWGTAGRFYVLLADSEGGWKEVATLQGVIHLSMAEEKTPIITVTSRGGSEDYLRQEYAMRAEHLELLHSRSFLHGVITDFNVKEPEQNRVEQAVPGYDAQGASSP